MSQPLVLLENKLESPVVDMRIVRRDSLINLLESSAEGHVTVLIAPTGYGKTTLLVEWLSTSRRRSQHAVWVTCDEYDNVPSHFWAYIISGLKKAYPRFHFQPQQIIEQKQSADHSTLLNPLLNEIAAVPHHITLVLDDYHAITNDVIQRQLGYFIEHHPRNLHLVVSSRVKPPIPLSRLRAQGRMLVLTERELAFSLSEAQSFLTSAMDLDIDQAQIITLWNATEGWIAGLQLAASSYSLTSHKWSPPPDVLRDNRMVLDYFSEEVLNQLSAPLREFLLKSSILEELSAPLCDAVLERNDSEELLSQIEAANLFMVCLDNSCGYRYHALFAQVLKTRLQQLCPEDISDLHLRACDWLLAHEQMDKAIAHALAAGALETAAGMVELCATEALFSPKDLTRLMRWMSLFSRDGDLLSAHPRLGLYYALADYYLQRWSRAKSTLHQLKQATESNEEPLNEADRLLRWQISALEAVIECRTGNYQHGIPALRTVLVTRPSEDHFFHGFAMHELAMTYEDVGQLGVAADTYLEVYQYAAKHNPAFALHSIAAFARTRKRQARLREARLSFQEAVDRIDELGPDVNLIAWALSGLLETIVEQNDMERADEWVAEVLNLRQQLLMNVSDWVWMGLSQIDFSLASYYLARGNIEEATDLFNGLKKYVPNQWISIPNVFQRLIDVQVLIGSVMDEAQTENQLLADIEVYLKDKTDLTLIEQLAQGRIHRAHKQFSQAQNVLERLEARVRQTEEGEHLLHTLVIKALVYQDLGDDQTALQAIEEALSIAEPNRYARVFIDEGPPMKHLLSRYVSGSRNAALQQYAQQLVVAFSAPAEPIADLSADSLPKTERLSATPAELTQRELEVLRLLMTPLSYKEIAAQLMISVNTVRIHVKSIFHKLDAHSRRAALERAKELNLLDDAQHSSI